jgi:cytidylate kinase
LSARKNENKIEVEKLIYQRIVSVSSNRKYTLIDGLASFDVLEKLIKVFNVKICYLNIDYQERIFRISKRQNINVDSAIALEKEIETNKEKSGLSKIIQLSNLVICDNSDDEVDVLRRWIYEK